MVARGSQLAFLSHSTSDGPEPLTEIDQIIRVLGVETFVAHRDIQPSRAWRDEIKRNLERCTVFVALLTDKFHESEWCDQEFGSVLARPDVVVVPVNVSKRSYGFLNDNQELPWKTGRYVSFSETAGRLAKCLIDRRVVDRESMIRGLASATNFRSADVVFAAMSPLLKAHPLTISEALALSPIIIANDQIYRNSGAQPLFGPQLAPHLSAIPRAQREALEKLGFGTAPP